MIYASAEALSTSLLPSEIEDNWLYPAINRIRDVSVVVTRGVIRAAQKDGMDRELALRNISDEELDDYIRERMYDPFTEHKKVDEEIKELAAEFQRNVIGSGSGSNGAATTVGGAEAEAVANGPPRGEQTHGDAMTVQAQ